LLSKSKVVVNEIPIDIKIEGRPLIIAGGVHSLNKEDFL
jgi:hypothetical protein